jgi:hypothetical protein
MVEILVACGVIMILMGLLFLGGKAVVNSNKAKSSKITLNNLRGMYTDYEKAVGPAKAKADFDAIFTSVTTAGTMPMGQTGKPLPVDVSRGSTGRIPAAGEYVGMTQNVIKLLSAIPANKTAINNLPQDQLLERSTMNQSPDVAYRDGAVLLDGFDNPIIAVPSTGVLIQHETDTAGSPRTIRSKDGKPFFMSAGPDGSFSLNGAGKACGDDNLYSTEN